MTLSLSAILFTGLLLVCQNLELSSGHDGQNTSGGTTNKLAVNLSNLTRQKNEFDWKTEYQKFINRALNRTNLTMQEYHDVIQQKILPLFPAQSKTTTTQAAQVSWLDEDQEDEYPRQPTLDSKRKFNWSADPPSDIRTAPIIAGGKRLQSSDLEQLVLWHVGIYSKAYEPYMQICGGTLVTKKAVISAAHCFWSERESRVLPASQFGVTAGKLYRPWNESRDLDAQHAEISSIHLPTRFLGAATSFQDDIAVVLLADAFMFSYSIRPLCVSFDEELASDLLRSGNEGLIVGWGLKEEDGTPAQTLQFLYMPYVPVNECIATAEPGFVKYITSDKICAGVTTGKALCRGDSGGGLVFFDKVNDESLPFLYGIASTAPRNRHRCNTHARATLTSINAHRAFLRTHVPDIEDQCRGNYGASRLLDPDKDRITQVQPVFNCNCFCNCNNSTIP